MAVRSVRMSFIAYEKGAPAYLSKTSGQFVIYNFKDIYESLLMTGNVGMANFGAGRSSYKPAFYLVPEPINALIPAFEIGRTRPHTFLSDWFFEPTYGLWYELPPISGEDAQVLFAATFLPNTYWRLTSRYYIMPNQPFCIALVLYPAVKDNLTLPYVRILWDDYEILFRPDIEPILSWRGKPVLNLGRVFGDVWIASPVFKFEGAVGALLILPVRGHLVIADARDWDPKQGKVTAFNPYIFGKNPREPLYDKTLLRVEGYGASAMFGFPSVDFSITGEMLLPPMPIIEPEFDWFGEFTGRQLVATNVDSHISTLVGLIENVPMYFHLYATGRPHTNFRVKPLNPRQRTFAEFILEYEKPIQSYFELISAATYIPPVGKRHRRPIVNINEKWAVSDCEIRVDESGAEADVTLHPKTPMMNFPILDSDYYCEIKVNWTSLKTKNQDLIFKGFITEVVQEEREGVWGNISYRLRIKDISHRLKEAKGDNTFPIFDGFTLKEVFEFCMNKVGLPPDEFLFFYGNNFILDPRLLWSQPTPTELPPELLPEPPVAGFPYWWTIENPKFTINVGQSLWDFLTELCLMSGNELIVDGEGIWVIPVAYEAPMWLYRLTDASPEGTPDAWSEYVNNIQVTGQAGWMPTTFMAWGKSPFGLPIVAFYEIPELIKKPEYPSFRGFRVSQIEVDDKLASPFLAYRRAYYDYLNQFRAIPLNVEVKLLDIPARPYLGIRDRVKIETKVTDWNLLTQIGLKPYPAHPQEFVVRRSIWRFFGDVRKCEQEILLTPPANIPYGLILPKVR